MSLVEMTEELALEGRSVIIRVVRFQKETSDGRVTPLSVEVDPPPGDEPIDVPSDIVVYALIYALKLNYDAEIQHGSDETPESYVSDVSKILLSQIEEDEPSSEVH